LERINFQEPETISKKFLEMKPKYSIPAIAKGDFTLIEGAAINLYLIENYGKNNSILPANGVEKAKALEWYLLTNATLHPAFSREFKALMFDKNTAEGKAAQVFALSTRKGVQDLLDVAERQLNETKFLTGETLTIADISLTVILNWTNFLPKEPKEFVLGSKTRSLMNTVSSLPAFQKSLQEEGIEYPVF
jgi:glutathione S-transferase